MASLSSTATRRNGGAHNDEPSKYTHGPTQQQQPKDHLCQTIWSGLEVGPYRQSSVSSYSSFPPPLSGNGRRAHASVVIDRTRTIRTTTATTHNETEKDASNESSCCCLPHDSFVVVVGGTVATPHDIRNQARGQASHQVWILELRTWKWQQGPPLLVPRDGVAAVVCRDAVYALGGGGDNDGTLNYWDTIERISVAELLPTNKNGSKGTPTPQHETTTTRAGWTTLSCRLSSCKKVVQAVTLYDRYIVVLGGLRRDDLAIPTVELVDVVTETVTRGPSMNLPRCVFAASVYDNCIWVVGGYSTHGSRKIESLEFWTKEEFVTTTATTTNHPDCNCRRRGRCMRIWNCLRVVGDMIWPKLDRAWWWWEDDTMDPHWVTTAMLPTMSRLLKLSIWIVTWCTAWIRPGP